MKTIAVILLILMIVSCEQKPNYSIYNRTWEHENEWVYFGNGGSFLNESDNGYWERNGDTFLVKVKADTFNLIFGGFSIDGTDLQLKTESGKVTLYRESN